jgi:hypothetical protein
MIDLRASVKREHDKTRPVLQGFPWENREAYLMWLAQTYYMVNHSTRLVALAGALAPLNQNDLHARFVDHSKEERGHQLICISDLKTFGKTVQDFPCLAPSASLYQVQYYWIQYRGSVSFFGYTLALECLSAEFGAEVNRRTLQAHGKAATKFVALHSEADLEHTEKAFEQLDKLSQSELALVEENLILSAGLYRSMLTEVKNSVAKLTHSSAA